MCYIELSHEFVLVRTIHLNHQSNIICFFKSFGVSIPHTILYVYWWSDVFVIRRAHVSFSFNFGGVVPATAACSIWIAFPYVLMNSYVQIYYWLENKLFHYLIVFMNLYELIFSSLRYKVSGSSHSFINTTLISMFFLSVSNI